MSKWLCGCFASGQGQRVMACETLAHNSGASCPTSIWSACVVLLLQPCMECQNCDSEVGKEGKMIPSR